MRILKFFLIFIAIDSFVAAEMLPPPPDFSGQQVTDATQQQLPVPGQAFPSAPGVPGAPGGDAITPESLQPPAEAAMMPDDSQSLPSSSPIILDFFKKASGLIDEMSPVAARLDEKRDSGYQTLFDVDALLDKSIAGILERVGKLEETFTPKEMPKDGTKMSSSK